MPSITVNGRRLLYHLIVTANIQKLIWSLGQGRCDVQWRKTNKESRAYLGKTLHATLKHSLYTRKSWTTTKRAKMGVIKSVHWSSCNFLWASTSMLYFCLGGSTGVLSRNCCHTWVLHARLVRDHPVLYYADVNFNEQCLAQHAQHHSAVILISMERRWHIESVTLMGLLWHMQTRWQCNSILQMWWWLILDREPFWNVLAYPSSTETLIVLVCL